MKDADSRTGTEHPEADTETPCAPTPCDEGATGKGPVESGLAELPERTILNARRLARLLNLTPRTLRRMVQRHELPPPVRLAGRSCWMAGKVLDHIEAVADRALKEAEKEAARIRRLSP